MAINYKVVKRAQPGVSGGGSMKYYAQVSDRSKVSVDDLCRELEKMSSLSAGDIMGVIHNLLRVIPDHLLKGETVDLGVLGKFSVYVRSEGSENPEAISARSITETRVHFRPGVQLKKLVENAEFKKAK